MTQADQQDAGNRRRLMTVICIMLMLLLMFQVTRLLNQQRSGWDSSVFAVLERDFQVAVATVYAEAKIQGRVRNVTLWQRQIDVNKAGRPAIYDDKGQLDCATIWQQVMGFRTDSKATPIATLGLVRTTNDVSSSGCRFIGSAEDFFDYYP
ncbi:hypothetical protein K0504_00215 [Neiella marina]|uniref:Uncharacterized protein n=1 Tax=Neiella holothuriorum TaxID=2870530 RepID=A0ABS7ECH3_9GAMM|nr:hypothetical protein [Neiella holothuriorum]MBW8189442.1 hypothetical protein [Neiella holothuriorum]